jgi:hypothetical protein
MSSTPQLTGRHRAKVRKNGRYYIGDFNILQGAADYVRDIKGVHKQFAGKAVVEGVTRLDTVRGGELYTYRRACRMHNRYPKRTTFSTKEKAEAWRPMTKKRESLSPEATAALVRMFGS